jgi:hypothetical protein
MTFKGVNIKTLNCDTHSGRTGGLMNTTITLQQSDLVGSFFKDRIADTLFVCIVLIYILFGADIATTTMILSAGGFEANTVMAPIVSNFFLHLMVKGLALVFIAAVAQWSDMKVRGSGLLMLLVITCWYSLVMINNVSVLIQLCGENCPFQLFSLF